MYSTDSAVSISQQEVTAPSTDTVFVGPHIVKVNRRHKEDDPEGQQHQKAVADGHNALVVLVGAGVGLCRSLLGIQVTAVAAEAETI